MVKTMNFALENNMIVERVRRMCNEDLDLGLSNESGRVLVDWKVVER